MTRHPRPPARCLACVALASVLAAGPAAAELTLEPVTGLPEGLAPAFTGILAADGVGVRADGLALTLWPVVEPPYTESASRALGVAYPGLTSGALVGLLEVETPWSDYCGAAVAPGLYTLRYLVQPDDGYHMGVSLYRDFLLLVPAAEDPGPGEPMGADALVEASRPASGEHHAAVLALVPVEPVEEATPTANDLDQPTLALPVGVLTLGLVVEGEGEG